MANRQVDLSLAHLRRQVHCRIAHGRHRDARGAIAKRAHQRRDEVHLADIRHGDAEGARAAQRIERHLVAERRLQRLQRIGNRFRQFLCKGCRQHALAASYKQRVAEQGAQAGQRVADRGLAEIQGLSGTGNGALPQQVIEHDQQVQIDVLELHRAASY